MLDKECQWILSCWTMCTCIARSVICGVGNLVFAITGLSSACERAWSENLVKTFPDGKPFIQSQRDGCRGTFSVRMSQCKSSNSLSCKRSQRVLRFCVAQIMGDIRLYLKKKKKSWKKSLYSSYFGCFHCDLVDVRICHAIWLAHRHPPQGCQCRKTHLEWLLPWEKLLMGFHHCRSWPICIGNRRTTCPIVSTCLNKIPLGIKASFP